MEAESREASPAVARHRLGRILRIAGWCLLLVLSAVVTYALMVIGGK